MSASAFVTIPAPAGRLTRVSWRANPFPQGVAAPLDWSKPRQGGRFDSPLGDYTVWYFASDAEAAFAEVLSHLAYAPDDTMARDRAQELEDFRTARRLVYANIAPNREIATAEFVDLEHSDTIRVLELALAPELSKLDLARLTAGHIKGDDRRLTRLISQQIHEHPSTLGIRFLSKLGTNHECWAIFADRASVSHLDVAEIHAEDSDFMTIARRYGLA